jgi:Domain of unknown function (DUF4386)
MENQSITQSQTNAAKVAGFMYLIGMTVSIFVELYLRGSLIVPGNASATADNIMAHETQFRLAIILDLLTYFSVAVLVWALYVLLKPVNRNLALLATFLRMAEVAFFCVVLLGNFVVLHVLNNADYLKAFEAGQLQAMSRVVLLTRGDAYTIGFSLLGLGSTVFSYVLFKSNYVPRLLAGWGIFSSLLLALGFITVIFPELRKVVLPSQLPMFIYEVGLGLWFVIKGVKNPEVKS